MPGVATRMLPVPADAEVIGYGARVNGVNGEIHPLEVNVSPYRLRVRRPGLFSALRRHRELRRKLGSRGSRSGRASCHVLYRFG
jgi:hypothetical protein